MFEDKKFKMDNDWVKPGARVYLRSYSNWIRSGYTTITEVDGDTVYLQRDLRIKVNSITLNGSFLEFENICHIYKAKEELEKERGQKASSNKKRQIIKDNLHVLTEDEIELIYNIVNKNHELLR